MSNAFVHASARIHPTAEIGPFCVVGPDVTIGARTKLLSHVVIDGKTTIGEGNMFYPGVCVGFPPQSKPPIPGSRVVIGDDNILREHVTIHLGQKDAGTLIGHRNFFMVGAHIGHDSNVGNDVILANQTALGGHTIVEDRVMIGGLVGVHQFVRIGKFSMVGGLTKTTQDVLPFSLVDGRPARLSGVNLVGLRRNGFSAKAIGDIRRAIRLLHYSGAKFKEALALVREEFAGNADVAHLVQFIENSKRGVVRRGIDRGSSADS